MLYFIASQCCEICAVPSPFSVNGMCFLRKLDIAQLGESLRNILSVLGLIPALHKTNVVIRSVLEMQREDWKFKAILSHMTSAAVWGMMVTMVMMMMTVAKYMRNLIYLTISPFSALYIYCFIQSSYQTPMNYIPFCQTGI